MTSYWLSDICSLTNSVNINPLAEGDKNFKFNSLTRLIIFVTIISTFLPEQNTDTILLAGCISVVLSIVIYMLTHNSGKKSLELNVDNDINNDNDNNIILVDNKKESLDHDVNMQNHVTLDFSIRNTDKIKKKLFLDKDDSPDNVTKTVIKKSDILTTGKQIPTDSVKKSLLGKNLSFP
tara:strand:+ start:342 stop:878 length:537 start_codon:yes stop_codon:yes gene_type:complete